jgi:hypothetical protein
LPYAPASAEPEVIRAFDHAFAFSGYVEGLHTAIAGGVHQAAAMAHHD